jgi:hypothetical protein
MNFSFSSRSFAVTLTLFAVPHALAEDVEYDTCSCKQVQIGAQSTLRGGLCRRTEQTANCLMEWDTRGKVKNAPGKGQSQEEASLQAEQLIQKGAGKDFQLVAIAPAPSDASPLQIAVGNLTRIPPTEYAKPGMADSFLLAAAAALVRFDAPVDLLAGELLGKQRGAFVAALQKENKFAVASFDVKASLGCLLVIDRRSNAFVYIKTPFASTQSC